MLIMTPKRIRVSGFTRGRNKYTDAQVAALIEDLDLVPALLITPSLIREYRAEVREQLFSQLAHKRSVEVALEYAESFLTSERGKALAYKYEEIFQMKIPFRNELQ